MGGRLGNGEWPKNYLTIFTFDQKCKFKIKPSIWYLYFVQIIWIFRLHFGLARHECNCEFGSTTLSHRDFFTLKAVVINIFQ